VSDLYAVNVEGAVYRDGEYLPIRRSEAEDHAAGEWGLVGGTVEGHPEADDALFATLRREVLEEVGAVAWVPVAELFDRELPPYTESNLREIEALRRRLDW